MGTSGSEDDSDVDIESVKDEEESGDSDRDEEEKWLDAVESGNVENHVDSELRSIQACPPTHFPQCLLSFSTRYTGPAEIFWVVKPQTPFKFIGQNLFGDQF